MADKATKKKDPKTPRQMEIDRLAEKGKEKRTDQESARLDQLRMEERRDRFLRLVGKRVNKAIAAIGVVGNLANKSTYEYNDEEASRIILGLEAAVGTVTDAFRAVKKERASWSL